MADSKGPDENRFNQLANSVEEFTTTMLDPLRSNQRRREEFGDDLDEILEDAIRLEQKKVRLKEIHQPTLIVFFKLVKLPSHPTATTDLHSGMLFCCYMQINRK